MQRRNTFINRRIQREQRGRKKIKRKGEPGKKKKKKQKTGEKKQRETRGEKKYSKTGGKKTQRVKPSFVFVPELKQNRQTKNREAEKTPKAREYWVFVKLWPSTPLVHL